MKKLLLAISVLSISFAQAQTNKTITFQDYQQLKQSGQLQKSTHYAFVGNTNTNQLKQVNPGFKITNTTSACGCSVPFDSSFAVVPFLNAVAPEYRNDDSYTDKIPLPFTFCFYGQSYDSLYINNNGNLSFTGQYSTFTADSFPSAAYNMLAPFWGDVDTRGAGGLVYYKLTPTSLIVRWDSVDVFNSPNMYNLRNSFQIIITNGSDPILPAGSNVAFCYGDMQWTTGDASSGVGGFAGVPATVGANQGNGTDYFQVGRFDQAGLAFDGPYNNSDGVDFLDNQSIYFDVCNTGNLAPIIINSTICDTIDVFSGDTMRVAQLTPINFDVKVSTPEINQTVLTAFNTNTNMGSNFVYTQTTNTPTYKVYNCTVDLVNVPVGISSVAISATDNGIPARTTTQYVVVNKHEGASVTGVKTIETSNFTLYPNPANDLITIKHNYNLNAVNELTLYNNLGELIKKVRLNSSTQQISIADLSAGVYVGKINANGKQEVFKLVKE